MINFDTQTQEALIGDPTDPDVIVRVTGLGVEIHCRPRLRATVRSKTIHTPRALKPMRLMTWIDVMRKKS